MITEMIRHQGMVFGLAIINGLILTFCYDLVSLYSKIFLKLFFAKGIIYIIYSLIFLLIFANFIWEYDNGELRLYTTLGFFLGILLYVNMISDVVSSTIGRFMVLIKRRFIKIKNIICKPLKNLVKQIRLIIVGYSVKVRKRGAEIMSQQRMTESKRVNRSVQDRRSPEVRRSERINLEQRTQEGRRPQQRKVQNRSLEEYSEYTEPKKDRATRRVGEVSRARRKNDNKAMMVLICGVVILFSAVFCFQIINGRKTLNKLRADENKLEDEYKKQQEISEELKEKEVYVKTNAYIEEQARKIGLVYPDEIIFKPEK